MKATGSLLAIAAIAACSGHPPEFEPVPGPIAERSAAADARRALDRNDIRFLAHGGTWGRVPGMPCSRAVPKGRLRIVAARGDIVARPETPADSLRERERLASMAPLELYMADYNRVIAVQTGFCPCAAAP